MNNHILYSRIFSQNCPVVRFFAVLIFMPSLKLEAICTQQNFPLHAKISRYTRYTVHVYVHV